MKNISPKRKTTGILLGRFQPFHRGHRDALEQITSQVEKVKILIGSSNRSRTADNPLTFSERREYLQTCGVDFPIHALPDDPSDDVWCEKLLRHANENTMFFSSNTYVVNLLKKKNIPCKKLRMRVNVNATKIRKLIRNNQNPNSFLIIPLPKLLIDRIRQSG